MSREMHSESWCRWLERSGAYTVPQMSINGHRNDQLVALNAEGAFDLLANGDAASKWGLTADDLIAMDL